MAKLTLKWEPKSQLREGLTKTIAYFEDTLRREGSDEGGRAKTRVFCE